KKLADEVLGLAEDQEEGCPPYREPAFLDYVDEPAPHDLEPDRISLDPTDGQRERHRGREHRLRRGALPDGQPKVEPVVDAKPIAGWHHRRRLELRHDRGAFERIARSQRVAIVDRRLDPAAGL